jgi:uncharacterized protein (TIGR02391 family)
MPQKRLNHALLKKMAAKVGKAEQYQREQISRRASKQGISFTAAQLVWAKEMGIGTANGLSKLSPEIRQEVQSVHSASGAAVRTRHRASDGNKSRPRKEEGITGATVHSLLQDQQLRERCKDLLKAKKHFDRVFREATTVLDDRLKTKSGISNMNPLNLVGKVLNPDPQKAVLEVSADKEEQEGFYSICKGVMLVFRNRAHHKLSDKFTKEDALKFCGFIDTILGIIDQATIHPERV